MNMETSNKIDQQMKEMPKLFEGRIDTADLIFEVERKPAIWDSRIEAFSDRIQKLNAWNNILKIFIPDFEKKPVSQKNVLVTIAQKKWRSIRTCYTRELLKKKNIESGSEAIKKKQYTYIDQLRFLEILSNKTTSSLEEDDDNSHDLVDTGTEVDLDRCENPSEFEKPKIKLRKRGKNEDDELIAVLKKKIAAQSDSTEKTKDEDRHFLLSLLSEIHKVPAERKLKLRSDIIPLIAAAQAPDNQLWPSYGGPPMPYPFHQPTQFPPSSYHQAPPPQVPPVSQYPTSSIHPHVPSQQTPHSGFLYLQIQPNKPIDQQNYLSPSPTCPSVFTESQTLNSPAQSDSSFSQTSDYVLYQ